MVHMLLSNTNCRQIVLYSFNPMNLNITRSEIIFATFANNKALIKFEVLKILIYDSPICQFHGL